MNIKKKIAGIKNLRKILIPLISKLNWKIKIKHDITKRVFHLRSWSHRGYWYYGKSREIHETIFYNNFIKNGYNIPEVGGHIGYITQIFENLSGDLGRVVVLEPSLESYELLLKNKLDTTVALNMGASNQSGFLEFYSENFGGFTNSLVKEFVLDSINGNISSQNSGARDLRSSKIEVDTIDNILSIRNFHPDFVKIDVEGAEFDVLSGMSKSLANVKALMIEISRNHEEVINLLESCNFIRVDHEGRAGKLLNPDEASRNYFYINKLFHPEI